VKVSVARPPTPLPPDRRPATSTSPRPKRCSRPPYNKAPRPRRSPHGSRRGCSPRVVIRRTELRLQNLRRVPRSPSTRRHRGTSPWTRPRDHTRRRPTDERHSAGPPPPHRGPAEKGLRALALSVISLVANVFKFTLLRGRPLRTSAPLQGLRATPPYRSRGCGGMPTRIGSGRHWVTGTNPGGTRGSAPNRPSTCSTVRGT
jgi:hypothetical protein